MDPVEFFDHLYKLTGAWIQVVKQRDDEISKLKERNDAYYSALSRTSYCNKCLNCQAGANYALGKVVESSNTEQTTEE